MSIKEKSGYGGGAGVGITEYSWVRNPGICEYKIKPTVIMHSLIESSGHRSPILDISSVETRFYFGNRFLACDFIAINI